MPTRENRTSSLAAGAAFAATRWSVVLAAAKDGTRSRRALEDLAAAYWFPLYAYIRRAGHDRAAAEDLTQEFFARLLEKKSLATVDRDKGKFRSFLLASLKHFLSNERDKARAQKRGGGKALLSLDAEAAEARYASEAAGGDTPERVFERRWALAVLDQVLASLRKEYVDRGIGNLFQALAESLMGDADAASRAAIASRLGMTEDAVNVAAHRMRKRYRNILREEIAQTVAQPELIDEEIRYLLRCMAAPGR